MLLRRNTANSLEAVIKSSNGSFFAYLRSVDLSFKCKEFRHFYLISVAVVTLHSDLKAEEIIVAVFECFLLSQGTIY